MKERTATLVDEMPASLTRDEVPRRSTLFSSSVEDRWIPQILLVVVAWALLLRVIDFQGFQGSDDGSYIQDAYRLARGGFSLVQTQWDVRIGIIAPLALVVRLFGVQDWSVALYPLCLSLASIPLIYLLGRTLVNREVGLLAALLLACFPQDIYYATLAYPDLPGAFYGALAVLLASLGKAAASPARRVGQAAASGLALVAAYLTWEANVVFLPICLLALWGGPAHGRVRRLLIVPGVLCCALALEAGVYWRLTGNPLFRLAALHHHTAGLHSVTLWHYIARWPAVLLNPGYPQTFFYVLLTIWGILTVRGRLTQGGRLALIWLGWTFALFAFAVTSVRPLTALLEVEPRYLSDLVYPALILAAQAVYGTFPRGGAGERFGHG
jgi:4-amino-4-deoxy-L-arabinose transferase-like glycosyltransferase